jgi:TonB family protein
MKKLFLLFIFFCAGFVLRAQTSVVTDSLLLREPEIFDRAEVMPTYPGGATELMKFISKNLTYPNNAREHGFQGKIVVKFTVDTDGSVVEPVILRNDGCEECGTEVIRVIKKFPKWTPGIQKGKPVKVYYTLPVNFRLDGESDLNNKEAIFKGDEIQLQNELLDGIRVLNKKNKANHSINILFSVSETGSVSNVNVESSNSISQQQIDKIKKLMEESKWYPAVKNGKIVAANHSINLNY